MQNLSSNNSKIRCYQIIPICFFILFTAPVTFAQSGSTTGTIIGRITDNQNSFISKATLTIKETQTNLTRNIETDNEGIYQVIQLPPGIYEVVVSAPGFSRKVSKVVINVGVTAILDLSLEVAAFEDVEEITTSTKDAILFSNGLNIESNQISNLPINRRSYLDFALTTPRVVPDRLPPNGISATSGLSINGQSARRNNLTIDGLNNTDFSTGSVRSIFGQDAIEQYQVVADSFSAEFGRALGGTINIVTKSGKNNFQATSFFSLRNDSLSARNAFTSINPDFRQYQAGINLSGAIKQDKAFFFTSFERISIKQNVIVTIPDLFVQAARQQGFPLSNGIRPFSVGITYLLNRLDWQITTNNRLTLRYNGGFKYDGAFDTEGASLGGLVSDTSSGIERLLDNTITLSNTYVNSRLNLVNETRLLYSYRSQDILAADTNPSVRITTSNGRLIFGHNQTAPQFSQQGIYQIVNNTSLLRGSHLFRFGVDLFFDDIKNLNLDLQKSGVGIFSEIDFTNNNGPRLSAEQAFDPKQRNQQQRAFLSFLSALFPTIIPNFPKIALADSPLPVAFLQGFGSSQIKPKTRYASTFFQDDFRIKPNLLLKAGLRYDFSNISINPTSNNNFSPRLSIAYQPKEVPKLTIKASYGLFFSVPLTSSTGLAKVFSSKQYQIQGFTFPFSVIPFNLPGHRFPITLQPPTNVSVSPQTGLTFTTDPNLSNSYSQQTNLALSYSLSSNTSISAIYDFVKGIKLTGVRDINKTSDKTLDPTKGSVFETATAFDSYYHALTLSFDKNFTNRFGSTISYTYSKAIDNVVDDVRADLLIVRSPNSKDMKGLSLQDLRHRFVASSIWQLDYLKKPILKDLQLSTIVTLESGRPYDLVKDTITGPVGIGGRNQGILPSFANVDLRLQHKLLKEHYQIQTYIEVFNLFNKVNIDGDLNQFFQPNSEGKLNLPPQENGRFILPQERFVRSFPPRQIQLGIRFSFDK